MVWLEPSKVVSAIRGWTTVIDSLAARLQGWRLRDVPVPVFAYEHLADFQYTKSPTVYQLSFVSWMHLAQAAKVPSPPEHIHRWMMRRQDRRKENTYANTVWNAEEVKAAILRSGDAAFLPLVDM